MSPFTRRSDLLLGIGPEVPLDRLDLHPDLNRRAELRAQLVGGVDRKPRSLPETHRRDLRAVTGEAVFTIQVERAIEASTDGQRTQVLQGLLDLTDACRRRLLPGAAPQHHQHRPHTPPQPIRSLQTQVHGASAEQRVCHQKALKQLAADERSVPKSR